MACTWFGEVPSCCSLTLLLFPAWVLLNYVLQTIFSGPVGLKPLRQAAKLVNQSARTLTMRGLLHYGVPARPPPAASRGI